MAKKKNFYIAYDLEFLEEKVKELKIYIEERPFSELQDRIEFRETKIGGMIPMVVATIEAQRKDLTAAMKEYAEMLSIIKNLKAEEEASQLNAKGSVNIPHRMRAR